MNKLPYILYGLWAVLAILSKILLGASWWVATSFLWIPAAVIFSVLLGLSASVEIGKWLKIRQVKADPNSCDNCLFGHTAQYDKEGKCLGENVDESVHRPHLCKFYQRHHS